MTDVPARLATAVADRYRIERVLGQGGMATVFLAEDLKHKRNVALKVLRPELAAVLGAERFVQEIATTASLQHPHILPLFDSGTADGFLFYVMPFIDGETLRARLDRETQLGVEEAVRIATEVADALDYAHRHGVIHRDIKPENILLHDGRSMVADFGIALAVSAAAGGRMTETGLSLGTPHYMSPEQATAEKEITARSDIYSIGSVLYEMLAGQPPHLGGSAQQIVMKIIAEPVALVTQHRTSVPPNVAAAVAKSLEKLPADRFESAKAFADALGNAAFTHGAVSAGGAAATVRGRARDPVFIGMAAIAVVGIAFGTWGRRSAPPPAGSPVAFRIFETGPAAPSLAWTITNPLAISSDGSRVVYNGLKGSEAILVVRELATFDSRVLAGTEGAEERVFSPDGRSIAFRAGQAILRVMLDGTPPVRIATLDRSNALFGIAWLPGDTLWYLSEGTRTISRLTMDGRSSPEAFPVPDAMAGTLAGLSTVPGTEWLLTSQVQIGADLGSVVAFSTRTREFRVLPLRGLGARVLPGGTAILLYKPGGVITLTAFDAKRLAPSGPEAVVFDGVAETQNLRPLFALSDNGTAVYVTKEVSDRTLVEVTRDGRATQIVEVPGAYEDPRWSPDGRRLAFRVIDGGLGDIWIYDRQGRTRSRLTNASDNFYPVWTRDGERIAFASRRTGSSGLWWRRVDGSEQAEDLQPGADTLIRFPHSITPDGRTLLYRVQSLDNGMDIRAMALGGGRDTRDVLVGPANDGSPVVSADGRWLAFVSDATGRNEVFVTPWPAVGRRVQISAGGGEEAVWNPKGGELFYRSAGTLVAARLSERGGLLEPTRRDTLFGGPYSYRPRWPQYDVSADGNRFLMVKLGESKAQLRVITRFDQQVIGGLAARARAP